MPLRCLMLMVVMSSILSLAQEPAAKPVIIVGVAEPISQSRALFQSNWERDQMVVTSTAYRPVTRRRRQRFRRSHWKEARWMTLPISCATSIASTWC